MPTLVEFNATVHWYPLVGVNRPSGSVQANYSGATLAFKGKGSPTGQANNPYVDELSVGDFTLHGDVTIKIYFPETTANPGLTDLHTIPPAQVPSYFPAGVGFCGLGYPTGVAFCGEDFPAEEVRIGSDAGVPYIQFRDAWVHKETGANSTVIPVFQYKIAIQDCIGNMGVIVHAIKHDKKRPA